ncbi:hypothetical protein ACFVHR_27680 [Streptomyces sp. NPDC127168]|uniref:hypothetical protein n=1 Tax=unclassified Streptomyces TaxID=2593676 RepID=UPI0036395292
MKQHHNKVVGALHSAEKKLEENPDSGARELAKMLLEIANQYAEGKVGNLLPSTDLSNVIPARDRRPLKLIFTASTVCAVTVGSVLLGVPDAAIASIVGLSGVVVISLTQGASMRDGLEILDSVRGIQRP